MQRRRIERLNEQLKRELTAILRGEVRDPRVGDVTITGVNAATDLSVARIHVQTLSDEPASREETLVGLRAASAYIRGELGRRLHIRRAPELIWQWDETLAHARRIEDLLAQVRPPAVADDTEDVEDDVEDDVADDVEEADGGRRGE